MLPSRKALFAYMRWVAVATVLAKSLALVSQIVLGHVLAVETYAVFALMSSALAMIAGFQNSGVSKALIQNHHRFDELWERYSAFAFIFGVVGAVLLLLIGVVYAQIYDLPSITWVIAVACASVPFAALNALMVAKLSVAYRFRDINLSEILRSLFYYGTLMTVAVMGGDIFTVAVATTSAAAANFVQLRLRTGDPQFAIRSPLAGLVSTFVELRWVILSSFLFAMAQRIDLVVLGKALSTEDLGFYVFGVMLVANLTVPLITGINQVLLPIFARVQPDAVAMREQFQGACGILVLASGLISLAFVGIGAVAIHLIWGSKWDRASVVMTLIAAVLPIRLLATVSGVGQEAHGKWQLRNAGLALDAVLLAFGAWAGATLAGVQGAACGVAVQRVVSGVGGYYFFARRIRLGVGRSTLLLLRMYAPYLLALGYLLAAAPVRYPGRVPPTAIATAVLDTALAVLAFVVVYALLNPAPFRTLVGAVQRKLRGSDRS